MTGVPLTKRPYSPDAHDATKWWHVVRSGMTAQEAVEVPEEKDKRVVDRAADVDVPSNYELHLMMLDGRIGFKM
jgi:hypothetical protein